MHKVQQQLLELINRQEISGLSLREISKRIPGNNSAPNIKHHLSQLAKKNLIRIDKANKTIERIKAGLQKNQSLLSIPLLGAANCGEALQFADEQVEGRVQVSPSVLGEYLKKAEQLFALRAIGPSMNQAKNLRGGNIDDGDYVIVDKEAQDPKDGDYVVSIIDGCANVKRFFRDPQNQQILLVSESTEELPPICIHQEDYPDFLINGKVILVIKMPQDLEKVRDASMKDLLDDLGPMSAEEHDYYENL